MRVALTLAVLALAVFVLYGWGSAARRILRVPETPWATAAATGMAALIFLGGLLNLARLAFPGTLVILTITGVGFGVAGLRKPQRSALWRYAIPVAVLIFVIATQVPPRVYNFHDDFQKYFTHPVRMIETGTVFGSPLSDIGLDTLGGQAFLDGFAVAFFPIQYINAVGAALGLFLCMMLAAQYKNVAAALSVFVIDPQYVNTSALYTAAFLIMAAADEASPAIIGLLWAALLAMKSTFVLFVAVHLVVRVAVKRDLRSTAYAALFLSPWILLHAPHYIQFLHAGPGAPDSGVRLQESFNIFSTAHLDYGSTPLAYTALMIAVAVCGVLIARTRGKLAAAASCFAMVAAYLIMIYVSGPRNAGYEQAIRYFTPFAMGIAPVAFGLAYEHRPKIAAAIAVVALAGFLPALRDRVEQAVHSGSVLAFSWLAPTDDYLAYNRDVLYGSVRSRVQAAQAKIPQGEEAVVWINTPFYLDYTRNRLDDVEPGAGLIAPWAKIPENARYFMFEYSGYANMDDESYLDGIAEGPDFMRRVNAARLNMTRQLTQRMQQSEKLYDDGGIAVFSTPR